jgi:hypothetical protein
VIEGVEPMRVLGEEATEVRIGAYEVFFMVCKKSGTREQKRAPWKDGKELR